MAQTDLLGILSLLLAVAGGAYLVWVRLLRSPPRALSQVESPSNDRTADTIPPALRPQSEISPKMVAKLARSASSPPAPLAPVPAASPDGKRSNVFVRSPSSTKVPAAAKAPSEPPKVAPKAPSTPPQQPAPAPAAAVVSEVYPSSKKISSASPEKPEESDPLPRFDNEEDEELEPTKMGAVVTDAPIQPVVEKIVFDEGADTPEGPALNVAIYALGQTDPGKRRKQNQDAFVLVPQASVFVVADGMGGHRGGQRASLLAVETIGAAFEQKKFDAAPHTNIPLEASELARSIQMANTAIFHEAQRHRDLAGMGTTLVAARFTEDKRQVFIGHVGDSRAYRLRDGVLKQMTADHTMADYGVTGPEGAHLSRALGVWPTVPIDLIMATPKQGDIYLICSDGLTKMIPDGTIATQLSHEENPKAAIERLIFFANAHGGKDNVTVVLLCVVAPDWTPPVPPP
jgi:serine/threonine protein phosphatase PrpC